MVRMQYVSKEVSEALVSQITKGFGIDVNIIFGDIDIVADTPIGGIVAIFDGEPVRIDAPDSTCKCNGWFRVGLF